MSKQAYQEKLEAQLAEWDARLDLIKAKAKGFQADAKIEYERQLAALERNRDEAQAKLADLRQRSEAGWDDLKEGTGKGVGRVWQGHGTLRLPFQIAKCRIILSGRTTVAEVLALVKEQKASRGTLVEWIYEGLGEDCESCLKMMYDHAHRYQDEMLEIIGQTHSDLGDEAPEIRTFKVAAFCGALELSACIDALRRETPGDLESSVALFRKKTQLVDQVNARLDEVRSPHAKAYMTCRAVLAANDDFELTPDDRNANRGEAFRRSQDFFRTEATVGMH